MRFAKQRLRRLLGCLASRPTLLVALGATRLLVFASLRSGTSDRLALSSTARQAGANPLGAAHGLLGGDPCSDGGQQLARRVGAVEPRLLMTDQRDVALAQLADQPQQLLDPVPAQSVHGPDDEHGKLATVGVGEHSL